MRNDEFNEKNLHWPLIKPVSEQLIFVLT